MSHRALWRIKHVLKNGDVRCDFIRNAITKEGERAYLGAIFRDTSIDSFYVRLFNDTFNANKTLADTVGEPSTSGYEAQLIERSATGWPTLESAIAEDESGTAQSGGSNSITLDTGANDDDDFYNYTTIEITGGPGIGQFREVVDYNGTSKACVVDSNWITQPTELSEYVVHANYYAISKVVSFEASGGTWGPVTHAGLVDVATGLTGRLFTYFPLVLPRTLSDGDTIEFSAMIKLK